MLHVDVAGVPENEGHWSSWLSDRLLDIIPGISIAIDATSSVSIDVDTLSADDESSMVILECNWVRIVSPIVQIV